MPSIAELVAQNRGRQNLQQQLQAPASPTVAAAPAPAPTPPIDQAMKLPQRGMFPASLVLASDRSDSSREFRGLGARSATFPYPPTTQAAKAVAPTVASSAAPAASGVLLKVNSTPNPVQNILNLIAGAGMVLSQDTSGGVTLVAVGGATDGLAHGTLPWETDPSSFIISEDFVGIQSGSIQPTNFQGPWGIYGWAFAQGLAGTAVNARISSWGALLNSLGGSISWENSSTSGAAATLFCNGTSGSNAYTFYLPNAVPLLENPSWKATFVWKFDGSLTQTTSTFDATKKSFYIGLAGPSLGATAQSTGTGQANARPNIFIGVRFDTSTNSPGTLTLGSAGSARTGTTDYGFTSSNNAGASGSFVGQTFTVSGFLNGVNNGTFLCIGSTSTDLMLANASGVAETHAGTAVSTASLNDAFYTFEAVENPTYTGSATRNNLQGQTFVTTVAPTPGVAHRLDIICTQVGKVTLTLDGSTTNTVTFTIPQMAIQMQYASSTQTANAALTNNYAYCGVIGVGGTNSSAAGGASAAAGSLPFTAGSQVTIAGLTSTLAPLNGSYTLAEVSGGVNFYFDKVTSNIAAVGVTAGSTVTGYPALIPFAAFGNDDSASVTASTMRFYWDYVGLAVNPGVNPTNGLAADLTKARYF